MGSLLTGYAGDANPMPRKRKAPIEYAPATDGGIKLAGPQKPCRGAPTHSGGRRQGYGRPLGEKRFVTTNVDATRRKGI